jgi:hypothetical protein
LESTDGDGENQLSFKRPRFSPDYGTNAPGPTIRFRVMIDGAPPGADHGADMDAGGWGTVRETRLYQLVRQTGPAADRTFEIEFFEAGVRAHDFTFR